MTAAAWSAPSACEAVLAPATAVLVVGDSLGGANPLPAPLPAPSTSPTPAATLAPTLTPKPTATSTIEPASTLAFAPARAPPPGLLRTTPAGASARASAPARARRSPPAPAPAVLELAPSPAAALWPAAAAFPPSPSPTLVPPVSSGCISGLSCSHFSTSCSTAPPACSPRSPDSSVLRMAALTSSPKTIAALSATASALRAWLPARVSTRDTNRGLWSEEDCMVPSLTCRPEYSRVY